MTEAEQLEYLDNMSDEDLEGADLNPPPWLVNACVSESSISSNSRNPTPSPPPSTTSSNGPAPLYTPVTNDDILGGVARSLWQGNADNYGTQTDKQQKDTVHAFFGNPHHNRSQLETEEKSRTQGPPQHTEPSISDGTGSSAATSRNGTPSPQPRTRSRSVASHGTARSHSLPQNKLPNGPPPVKPTPGGTRAPRNIGVDIMKEAIGHMKHLLTEGTESFNKGGSDVPAKIAKDLSEKMQKWKDAKSLGDDASWAYGYKTTEIYVQNLVREQMDQAIEHIKQLLLDGTETFDKKEVPQKIIEKYTAKFKQYGLDTVVQAFWSIWEAEKSRRWHRKGVKFIQYLEGNRKDALNVLDGDTDGPDKMRRTIREIEKRKLDAIREIEKRKIKEMNAMWKKSKI